MGAFHIGIQKNRAIHILFVEKRGPIIYLAALKKGAIRHAHPYYAIYRKLPPRGVKCRMAAVKASLPTPPALSNTSRPCILYFWFFRINELEI